MVVLMSQYKLITSVCYYPSEDAAYTANGITKNVAESEAVFMSDPISTKEHSLVADAWLAEYTWMGERNH